MQDGWDWNRVPGATTIHLPYPELESPLPGTLMERNPERFSGASSLEGRNGVLAFQFVERDRKNFTPGATAHKSVFCFDNRMIFLGSGIDNDNQAYPTETTLFQLRMDSPGEQLEVDGEIYDAFPLNLSKGGERLALSDTKGNFYVVKNAAAVNILKQEQTSPNDKTRAPQTGNFATAYIDHGRAPKQAGYCLLYTSRMQTAPGLVFDVGTHADDAVAEEKPRFARPQRTVVFVVLVEFHSEHPVAAPVADASGESLVGEEHLLVARAGVDVPDVGLHPLHRDFERRRSGNVPPVPALLPEPAAEGAHGIAVTEQLHAAVRQVAAVVVGSLVNLRRPEVAAVARDGHQPVGAPVRHRGIVAVDAVPRRRKFGCETLFGEQPRVGVVAFGHAQIGLSLIHI